MSEMPKRAMAEPRSTFRRRAIRILKSAAKALAPAFAII